MSAPYMRLFVGDYLGDTQHLTTEQHGAYLLLLMAMWRSGGRLPNDPAKLARIARVHPPRWPKIAAEVMAFFDVEDGDLTQKRLVKEIEKASLVSHSRASAGARGGEAKALKNKQQPVANASDLPPYAGALPEPYPDKKETPIPLRGLVPQPSGKGAYLDPGWYPKPEALVWATDKLGSTERALTELQKFRDYWAAASGQAARKRDWDAAFRVWCSKAAEFERRPPPGGRAPPRRDPFAAMHDQLLEARNGQQQQPFDLGADDATAALFRPRLVYAGGDSG